METKLCKSIILDKIKDVPFKDDVMLPHPSLINLNYYDFITSTKKEINAKIDISTVVGGSHRSYVNKTWFQCLNSLRSQAAIDTLNCNEVRPSVLYYTDIEYRNNSCEDPWTVDVINGVAYITQGHHRSIISKFLSSVDIIQKEQFGLNEVRYIEYSEKYFRLYNKLLNYINNLPQYILEEIKIQTKHKSLEKNGCIEKFETIYSLYSGWYYDNIDISKNQKMYTSYTSFSEFRANLFKQIRYYKKTKKLQCVIQNSKSFLYNLRDKKKN